MMLAQMLAQASWISWTPGAGDLLVVLLFICVALFIWHSPILKPWFGFRKPPGHRGKWFQ